MCATYSVQCINLHPSLRLHPNLPGWGEAGAVTSVGWQITLCDPIDKWHPVVLR